MFCIDEIAQEENETLTLELDTTSGRNALPSGDGVFFRNMTDLTIVDSDSKISHLYQCFSNYVSYSSPVVKIHFTEDNFHASEDPNSNPDGTGNMPVRVIKTLQIANPIILEVVPLTVANTSLLVAEIPVDNPFSPPCAGKISFSHCSEMIAIFLTFF